MHANNVSSKSNNKYPFEVLVELDYVHTFTDTQILMGKYCKNTKKYSWYKNVL